MPKATTTVRTLKVPGATLRYETRGFGPVLLLVPGGGADAALFDGVADALARHFTVVAYDPRGRTRSPLDGPPEDQSPQGQSQDAALLLAALTDEPAYVAGTSAGAVVALDLLQRHPELVRRVVAHEPPLVGLLPDAAQQHRFFASVVETYRAQGLEAAMAVMAAGTDDGRGAGGAGGEHNPPPADVMARVLANLPSFLERELLQFTGHMPDLDALAPYADRLVPAAGEDSYGLLLRRPAEALAERLGSAVTDFPGGHLGCAEQPAAFADRLIGVLSAP
ncbi:MULTISPECIES: alpha/beta fold hydrolase [unclassified Streptomyces]|uniref:alpha/beta fold hydrolase n=1 Tax=unclassified Streptomyces TaxID=2593676 RepID=UPI00225B17DE|nr:alpha/beta hydrolase [Streptomyces sp. NBC_01551]MCX4526940.1 alpha/beta hydrolase [Streptomyces sp. NBC_01551]